MRLCSLEWKSMMKFSVGSQSMMRRPRFKDGDWGKEATTETHLPPRTIFRVYGLGIAAKPQNSAPFFLVEGFHLDVLKLPCHACASLQLNLCCSRLFSFNCEINSLPSAVRLPQDDVKLMPAMADAGAPKAAPWDGAAAHEQLFVLITGANR